MEYEEINVTNYIKVIRKRKRLIFGVFLIFVIAAVVYSFFICPKVYKIDTLIEIGRIGDVLIEEEGSKGVGLIEEPSQVKEKIDGDVYGILVRKKLEIPEEKYPKIKTENPEDTNLVVIEIKENRAKLAKNILEEINSLILADHQEKRDKKKTEIEENIKEIQKELTLLETEKQYSEGIAELQIEILNLKNQMNSYKSTKVVKTPAISENPIKPRPVLNIVIAGALGIFIGVFLALGKEWWEKSESRI